MTQDTLHHLDNFNTNFFAKKSFNIALSDCFYLYRKQTTSKLPCLVQQGFSLVQLFGSFTKFNTHLILRFVSPSSSDCLSQNQTICGYIHNKMSQTQLLCPFQKGKDLKLKIEMACNHCTKLWFNHIFHLYNILL
jgi:hypothetical protein